MNVFSCFKWHSIQLTKTILQCSIIISVFCITYNLSNTSSFRFIYFGLAGSNGKP